MFEFMGRDDARRDVGPCYLDNPTGFKFRVVREDGELVECEALFMFDLPSTGKSYIAYTDNSTDEDGNAIVYASTYDVESIEMLDQDVAQLALGDIETEEEWAVIEGILAQLQDEEDEPAPEDAGGAVVTVDLDDFSVVNVSYED